MRHAPTALAALLFGLSVCVAADARADAGGAAARDPAAQAVAMVGRAVALIRAEGPEKAYATFTARDPRFVDHDLYVLSLIHISQGIVR